MQGDRRSDSDLFLEVDGVGVGLVLSHGDLLEGRLELPRRVREGDPWAARLGPVGHHDPRHLVGERVQAIGCVRPMASAECGEQLVARGAARPGGEEAERDVERWCC